MDKQRLAQDLYERLQARLKTLSDARAVTQQLVRDSPGANTSRSDQSKNILSRVQLVQQATEIDFSDALKNLIEFRPGKESLVKIGAIFTLRNLSVEELEKTYFVVPAGCGGEQFTVEGRTITTLAAIAPLAQWCKNKEEGDEVIGGGGAKYEIIAVE